MISKLPNLVALALGAFAITSCQDTLPTQPDTAGEPSVIPPSFALASNSWTARAPIPTDRAHLDAGVVNNSAGEPILYVVGGYDQIDQPVSRVEAYNYSTNRWITKAASGASVETNGVGVIGGKLYISGGVSDHGDGWEAHSALVAYDPVSDAFSIKANMPRKVSNGVSGVIGGRLYVLTGFCGDCTHTITRRLYRYDPSTNAWNATLTWCPNAHVRGAGGVINGKFYVAGGVDANGNLSAKLDVYDPATNSWKALAPMPSATAGVAGAVIKNKLYIMGVGGTKIVYSYDPVTNRWTTKAPMLTGRSDLAAASLVTPSGNPKILAVGGFGSQASFRANELYTP